MTDFDPFGDFGGATQPQVQPEVEEPQVVAEAPAAAPVAEVPVEQVVPELAVVQTAPEVDPMGDLLAEQPKEEPQADQAAEEVKESMFGQETEQAPLPQEQTDLDRYNELQRKYQQHLIAKEDEQVNQATQLENQATDYRVDWKRKQEEFAEKQILKQNQEWDDMQKMIKDDNIGSWLKIGKLSGAGEGRIFEVLQLKIQDEKDGVTEK